MEFAPEVYAITGWFVGNSSSPRSRRSGGRASDFQCITEGVGNSFIVFPCFPETSISTAYFDNRGQIQPSSFSGDVGELWYKTEMKIDSSKARK